MVYKDGHAVVDSTGCRWRRRMLTDQDHENMTELTSRIRRQSQLFTLEYRIILGHPAVLWQVLAGKARAHLVERGLLPRTAKQVAEIRAAFETHAVQGEFEEAWFDINILPWCVTFSKIFNRADPVRILEIGSWEGRSTLFFLTYFTQGHLTAVDTWGGSEEHKFRELRDMEVRFDGNTAPFRDRLTKRKGSSLHVLPQLLDEEQKFDVIYVDGSHFADDVLTDGINAWRLLKEGGVLIFDDLVWKFYPRPRANPAWAIESFLKYYAGQYNVLSASNQLILQKKVAFSDQVTEYVHVQTD